MSKSFMQPYLENLESIACPLCDSEDFIPLGKESRGGFPIQSVGCERCGLVYLNPKPSAERYGRFYATGDYRRFLNLVKGKKDINAIERYFTTEQFERRKADGKEIAEKFFSFLTPNDLYFDFGCDCGGLLAGVQEKTGCQIMGLEPSEACFDFIQKKLGIQIYTKSLEDLREEEVSKYAGKVKLASITGALEHVNEPVTCLKIISKFLASDGYLYVESFDLIKRMKTKIERVSDVATIDHQHYFYPEVYRRLLEVCGFDIVQFDYDSKRKMIMRVLAKKTDFTPALSFQAKDKLEEILQLNQKSEKYRRSLLFRFKKLKEFLIKSLRSLARKLLRR